MELGKTEINEAQSDAPELGFDPDKLIGGIETHEADARAANPEATLHDPETIYEPVDGLEQTQEGFQQLESGNVIFDRPHEAAEFLNSDQGHVFNDVRGDCGLVSIENICRLAGKDVSEADVVVDAIATNECYYNPADCPVNNGGTDLDNIERVLEHFGIDSDYVIYPESNEVADAVESGKGVIACVDAAEYNSEAFEEGLHAITVTSVERDPDGDVVAFYVCDSGTGGADGCKRVGVDTFESSAFAVVITDATIR